MFIIALRQIAPIYIIQLTKVRLAITVIRIYKLAVYNLNIVSILSKLITKVQIAFQKPFL